MECLLYGPEGGDRLIATFVLNSPHAPLLAAMAYSFIELDKAAVHVTRLVSCLGLWFLSVCPLMPPLSVYCLTGISLTLDLGYLLKAGPAKRSCRS